jgi:hypothetical protein
VARDTKLFLDNKLCDDWCFEETKLDELVSLRYFEEEFEIRINLNI